MRKTIWLSICIITGLLISRPTKGQEHEEHYSFEHINTEDGLINNQTTSIFKDSRGFLWFGTSAGLSRYDGTEFRNYSHNDKDSTSILDNYIVKIQEDRHGDLWIKTRWEFTVYDFDREVFIPFSRIQTKMNITGTVDDFFIDQHQILWFRIKGQNYFQYYDEKKKRLVSVFDKISETPDPLIDVFHDGKRLYYLFSSGILECYSDKDYQLIYRDIQLKNHLGADSLSTKVYADHDGALWVFGNNRGIYHMASGTQRWSLYSKNSGNIHLSSNLINKVAQDEDGKIWIGTDHGGIDIYDKEKDTLIPLYHQPQDSRSIAQNSITDLLVDDEGIVWIGTYKKGISYYHPSIIKFPLYHNLIGDHGSLPFDDVNCFTEDGKGNLWIGTNGGGLLYYDRQTENYSTFRNEPGNSNSLSNDVIVSLYMDHEGLLWIGTFTGGLNVFDGKKFRRYQASRGPKPGLTNNNIWTLTEDERHRIWIGTLGGGIVLFDKRREAFVPLPNSGSVELPSQFISDIYPMKDGTMFIGTAVGICFYNMKEGRIQNHPYQKDQTPFSISNNNVNAVYEDSRGLLWTATREGLSMINPKTNEVLELDQENGLPEDMIDCILEDADGSIWVSKSTGLSQVRLENQHQDTSELIVRNYTREDGLQGEEFNINSCLKTSRGELIFGGPNGFNLFIPENITFNTHLPDLIFIDFQIFNKSLGVGEKINNRVILQKSITNSKEITLKHSMNVFSIEFAALNYFNAGKVRYQYKLEGFDKEWINADPNIRKATYTNLNPGDYTFQVMASNNDGFRNDQYATLDVHILPPFYKTPVAYSIYALLIVALLFYYRHIMLLKQQRKFELEQERLQARRHLELDEMKLKFLTNVSHEFRTPLTLILSPLERLMKICSDQTQTKMLHIIERNTHQLLGLVNQLLDFRKLDLHGLQYTPSYGDMVSFLENVCSAFSESFKRKKIRFSFHTALETCHFQFDQDKIQKVMMNLLSNALKFTQEGGEVFVTIGNPSGTTDWIRITVRDSGIGIPEEEQEKIFERFYQSGSIESLNLSGSGIGLNLVKEMVQLHDGTIQVESTRGRGAEFIIILPVSESGTEEVIPEEEFETGTESFTTDQSTILLVEDNADFRVFMKETLQDLYQVLEAKNGEQGYDLVHKKHPDLIISDVMMPGMDGMDLCKKLKADLRTSHIPIILLTARTTDEDKIRGLEIGADDYITKPFKMDLLLLRLQKLIDRRKDIQQKFQKKIDIEPSEIEISSLDEQLIKKAIQLVEKNISESGFTVEDLSHELGMSRVYLYKKLMAITGKSPLEFIRIIRLKRGAQLLEKSQMTIAEVAYEVGFNNPRYFSKYFEEEYGLLPSRYVKKHSTDHKQKIN